jgi:hypothetical protein
VAVSTARETVTAPVRREATNFDGPGPLTHRARPARTQVAPFFRGRFETRCPLRKPLLLGSSSQSAGLPVNRRGPHESPKAFGEPRNQDATQNLLSGAALTLFSWCGRKRSHRALRRRRSTCGTNLPCRSHRQCPELTSRAVLSASTDARSETPRAHTPPASRKGWRGRWNTVLCGNSLGRGPSPASG